MAVFWRSKARQNLRPSYFEAIWLDGHVAKVLGARRSGCQKVPGLGPVPVRDESEPRKKKSLETKDFFMPDESEPRKKKSLETKDFFKLWGG